MKITVKPHYIQVEAQPVNELEINITKCYFEFSEEITNDFVKEAYFTLDDGDTYKQIIVNNECEIPHEVLTKVGTIEIGVVAYLVENEEEIKRYNPKPGYFTSWEGSLKDAENSEEITPSEMEQYEQALQDGLNQVANVNIASEQLSNGTSVTITDRNGVSNTTYVYNGQDGTDGANGITPTIGNNGNWYLGDTDTGKPSRGVQGETGPAGQDGQNGSNGQDGFSPSASVSKSGSVATISITDKNGTTTTTISDGTNGQNGADGVGVPSGGTQGQILAKSSGTDYDTTWINSPAPDMSNYYTKSDTDTLLGGKQNTLTAGTNIEITNQNVINNTIKYSADEIINNNMKIGTSNTPNSYCTLVGANANNGGLYSTAIGGNTYSNTSDISIGYDARAMWNGGIAIGRSARNTKTGQAMFGSSTTPINEATIYTSSGAKVLATESYVDNSISSAITDALGGSY